MFKAKLIGTTDKNGVPLREGDIVKYVTEPDSWAYECTAVVRYVPGWCHFVLDINEVKGAGLIAEACRSTIKIGSVYE